MKSKKKKKKDKKSKKKKEKKERKTAEAEDGSSESLEVGSFIYSSTAPVRVCPPKQDNSTLSCLLISCIPWSGQVRAG